MIAAIHQPNFIPWSGYFYKISCCDLFVLLDTVQFEKNGYQNRNRIKTPNGVQWLTVPVHFGGHLGQSSNMVAVAKNLKWGIKAWRTLQQNYGKAKYFQEYAGYFEELFSREWEALNDLNITLLLQIISWLELQPKILRASSMTVDGTSSELLVNICSEVGAGTYLSGYGGSSYMDYDLFARAGIVVETYDFISPVYPQLYGDFVPNLSILDLLFNCGPESRRVLLSGGKKGR